MDILTTVSYILGLAEAFLIGELWGRPEVPLHSTSHLFDVEKILSQNKDFSLREKKFKSTIAFLKSEKRGLESTIVEMSKYGNDMCDIVAQNQSDMLSLSQLIDTYKLKLETANTRITTLKLKLIEYDNLHKRQTIEISNLKQQNTALLLELKKYKKD